MLNLLIPAVRQTALFGVYFNRAIVFSDPKTSVISIWSALARAAHRSRQPERPRHLYRRSGTPVFTNPGVKMTYPILFYFPSRAFTISPAETSAAAGPIVMARRQL